MRKQFFKRSVQIRSSIVVLVIMCIGFFIQAKGCKSEAEIKMMLIILYVVGLAVLFVIGYFVLPDFKYWIRVEDGYIIFEKNETDHRPILRKYSVIRQTRKEIVLEDERGTIISLAYNGEVLEFLNQVRIE